MRKIGELPSREQAIRFCDYLLTKNISAMAEAGGGEDDAWMIWIRDEDLLSEARAEFSVFADNPKDSKFDAAEKADEIRKQQEVENKERLKLQRKVGGAAWSGSAAGLNKRPVLTISLIVCCVLIFFITDPGSRTQTNETGQQLYQTLRFVDYQDYVQSQGDPLASIEKGEVWRIFTPNLLHGSMMHLGFNMMALFFLGGIIERLQSPRAVAGLILLTGVVAIVVQALFPESLGGSPNVVGISGAIYGLFGYLWVRPILQPSFPNVMPPSTVMLMLLFMVMFIVLPRGSVGGMSVANIAHVAGLFAGIACAGVASRLPS